MNEKKNSEKPEVYALRKDGNNWQISRRNFLKAAGIGAAAIKAGLSSRPVSPAFAQDDEDDMVYLCQSAIAHKYQIIKLMLSHDGKYLISFDDENIMKCWDFQNHSLLGSVNYAFRGAEPDLTGYVDGVPAVISARVSPAGYYKLPLEKGQPSESLTPESVNFKFTYGTVTMDSEENIYGADSDNNICILRKADNYAVCETLCTMENDVKTMRFLEAGRKFFIQLMFGFGILEPVSGEFTKFEGNCYYYDILPDESAVLILEQSDCRLVSLDDGHLIWSYPTSELIYWQDSMIRVSVSPDGTAAVIGSQKNRLFLISMEDGSPMNEFSFQTSVSKFMQMVFSSDGTALAVSLENSIFFLSLPDFKILGCPVDLSEVTVDKEAIEVSGTDPVTGQSVTYTLPCGAVIPAGAVCTCNCVAGTGMSCVDVCTCVGNICNCVGHTVSHHYWHPN